MARWVHVRGCGLGTCHLLILINIAHNLAPTMDHTKVLVFVNSLVLETPCCDPQVKGPAMAKRCIGLGRLLGKGCCQLTSGKKVA